jgi:endoglucanase
MKALGRLVVAFCVASLVACGSGSVSEPSPNRSPANVELLRQTWRAYVGRFIQGDGRVIDPKTGDSSTSEGQAYAMLRAVWMDDRAVFERTYTWARNNLNAGVRSDSLWAWKWGRAPDGSWRVLDAAFASDADQDAALALIMASRQWNDATYLQDARRILADLWTSGTVVSSGRRLLLGGDSLCQGRTCRLNPSYYAPYAYRIFAKHDPAHPWMELVEGSYYVLEATSSMTATLLPTDWVLLDSSAGTLRLGNENDSQYSYDAFRTHWRIAADAQLHGEPRADAYLRRSLAWVVEEWKSNNRLPAAISREGVPRAGHEAPEMLAALAPAVRRFSPEVGDAMYRRVQSGLSGGFWSDRESYYLQNWAWFGSALYEGYLTPLEAVR